GKGMGGGRIVIVPELRGTPAQGDPALVHGAGNAVLYGATGGSLFVAGAVGQRFAVRNSGARAVVEGCSDHGCEYMTNGLVAVLGPVGRNFGAGMTGGAALVWDPERRLLAMVADTAPSARAITPGERSVLRSLLEEHAARTNSVRAAHILGDWDRHSESFWVLAPAASHRVPGLAHAQESDRAGAGVP
nr:glutamate synthase subunit alpha [Gemmatimonadales bacterium]